MKGECRAVTCTELVYKCSSSAFNVITAGMKHFVGTYPVNSVDLILQQKITSPLWLPPSSTGHNIAGCCSNLLPPLHNSWPNWHPPTNSMLVFCWWHESRTIPTGYTKVLSQVHKLQIAVAERSKPRTVFARSNTAIVGSNPTEAWMFVCVLCAFFLFLHSLKW
jgi:hypothetical protein